MDKGNVPRTTSSRSLESATFHLADWRLLHPAELSGDLPATLECHILKLNMIAMQLSDAHTSIPQYPAHFNIPLTSVHVAADDATHALVSSNTVKLTFSDEEEDVVMNEFQKKKKNGSFLCVDLPASKNSAGTPLGYRRKADVLSISTNISIVYD